jgi:uncharacterized protein YllA (UPF0747 family)
LKKLKWKKIDEFCADNYLVTIEENGKVSKVTMNDYQSPDTIEKYWDKWEYDSCINTIFKALKNLKFDIIKDKGKPISETFMLEYGTTTKKERLKKLFKNKTTATKCIAKSGADIA